jgi:DNA repair exonuclease SbcCD ATPase subunit
LFNKKKKQQQQQEAESAAAKLVAAPRAEAELDEAIRARLDTVLAEKAELEQRIAALDEANAKIDSRLAALDHGVVKISEELLNLSSASRATSDRLRSIDERGVDADGRLDAIDRRLGEVESLAGDLDEINARIRSFEAQPAPADPPTVSSVEVPAEVPAAVPAETQFTSVPPPPPPPALAPPPPAATATDELSERIAELRDQLDDLARQTSTVDARVTSVSMELANQLTELSSDIDELNRRSSGSTDGASPTDVDTAALEARIAERLDAAIDDVLDSTERLAAEQARYEIQFRADLAELANRLRRPGS